MLSRSFGLSRIRSREGQGAPAASGDPRKLAALFSAYEDSRLGWFWATDAEGRLTYLSPAIAELLGGTGGELLGRHFASLFELDRDAEDASQRTLPFLLGTHTSFVELKLCATGKADVAWWAVSGRPQSDAEGNFLGYNGHGREITETLRSQRDASRLAMYDSLTGLSNRHRMAKRLDATLTA
jgi:PAS domain S-box-containing protein